jgi:DNA-binding NarL/FixJ family response regulator
MKEVERILAEPYQHLDLVISDVSLSDGTGLDVVRAVRSNLIHGRVPVLILSGRADPATVSRAYALGASSYVTKDVRGRTTAQVVRTIYDHWLHDARLPPAARPGRTYDVIARAMLIRSRIAQRYITTAEQLGSDEGDFWMGVAQREGNLANLLMFLLGRIGDREAPDDVLDELEVHQRETLRLLDELDRKPPTTEDDAFRYLLALSVPTDTTAFARFVGLLFPVSPVATAALLDAQATNFEVVSAQIEARTGDAELRQGAAQLRGRISLLRSQMPVR